MVRAVIFDLDDTLISEQQYIDSGYLHVSQLLSKQLNQDPKNIYFILTELFNENPRNVFNRLFDLMEKSYTNEMIMDLVEAYRKHEPIIDFYDDVLPCLEFLKQYNVKTGIITNGYAIAQKKKLIAVGGFELFDEIIITDELGSKFWKPHAKAYRMMKDKLKIDYAEMVYVGDNVSKDFVTPNTLGMKTVHIERKNGIYLLANHSYGQEFHAHYSIKCLNELCDLLF